MMFALTMILITPFALAASAFTEFEGSGDLSIKTTITSTQSNSYSQSDLELHTGCEACCCCPGCEGEGYEGYQYLSSNPFMAGTEATVDDGCVDIEIIDVYDRNGEVTYTQTNTGFIDGGSASAFLFRDGDEGYGYQSVEADSDIYVFFYQDNYIGGEFDYATNFGGIVLDSENGTAEMENYFLLGSPSIIASDLSVNCDPFGMCYTTFYVATTDVFAMNAYLMLLDDVVEWYNFVDAEGSTYYVIVTDSYEPIDFGFIMELG